LGYITVKEESLIYNPQTSFPNNELTDVGLGIKPKSTIIVVMLLLSSWFLLCNDDTMKTLKKGKIF